MQAVEFDAGKRHGKGLVAHIEGVDDRSLAESLQGAGGAGAQAEQLPAWKRVSITGTSCRAAGVVHEGRQRGVLLGTVDYLIETGANDVLVVAPCRGQHR